MYSFPLLRNAGVINSGTVNSDFDRAVGTASAVYKFSQKSALASIPLRSSINSHTTVYFVYRMDD